MVDFSNSHQPESTTFPNEVVLNYYFSAWMAIRVSGQRQKHGALLADEITKWLLRFSGDPLPPPSYIIQNTLLPPSPPPATAAAVVAFVVAAAITVIVPPAVGRRRRRRCPRVAAAAAPASSAAAFSF